MKNKEKIKELNLVDSSLESMSNALTSLGIKVCGTMAEFFSNQSASEGLWISAEESTDWFDYYSDNFEEIDMYLNMFVESHGYYFEWYDAGTIMLVKE